MTIGVVGLGKIGLPMAKNLIASGHDVIGYRRSAMDDLVAMGGHSARSPAEVGESCDVIFSCMPTVGALREVIEGSGGLIETAREGQIIAEFGLHPLAEKTAYVAPLAAKGAVFLDGEISGTPGMLATRTANVLLAGPREAADRIAPAVQGISDKSLYLGAFGGATKAKLASNILVALHIAGAAQAISFGLKLGVDKDLLLAALTNGSGSSAQLAIRGPLMVERKFLPLQGPAPTIKYFLEQARENAKDSGIRTDLIDCLYGVYDRAIPVIGDRDVAAILDYFDTCDGSNGANA
jgi:3-hydroxyisobutyrate dehydrogenase-like beta-hydroxyacid dehydrogenase